MTLFSFHVLYSLEASRQLVPPEKASTFENEESNDSIDEASDEETSNEETSDDEKTKIS